MKKLLTGNEAVARGVYEAGVRFAAAYPGTPSTEILENIATYDAVHAEWASNEKVALESAIGASFAGVRAFASMKHVGVNVAADPLFSVAYTGIHAGLVLLSADEPGQFSSQNEQDNRNYAKAAKIPMLEPSDSEECRAMIPIAFAVSEEFDTPVLFRVTTRICHSKSIVDCGERTEVAVLPYEKQAKKYVTVPANSKLRRVFVEERMAKLAAYSEASPLNFAEYHDKKIGVVCSGICYQYAKEVFGENASYLKLGFTNPLPTEKLRAFCASVETIYVLEENDPYLEEAVRCLGFDCKGKNCFPAFGEMTPDVVRKAVYQENLPSIPYTGDKIVPRPPTFCAGCPHRGFFYELGKRKNVMVSGDIGCYTLAFAPPYQAMDLAICMGSSLSIGHGAQQVFDMVGAPQRVVAVLGDSTFFHTGINSLLNTVYNGSNTISVILDNRITGMTGHQDNPGTGYTAKGEEAGCIDIVALVKATGMPHVYTVDPNNLAEVNRVLDECLSRKAPAVIITRYPCVLKKLSRQDKEEFSDAFAAKCKVIADKCIGCRKCLSTGCPALHFDPATRKTEVDPMSCVGCTVCAQVCPVDAIEKEVR